MTTTRMALFIDALVIAARTALPAVSVVDGPPLDWDDLQLGDAVDAVSEKSFLFVGATPGEDGGDTALDYGGAGNVSQDEVGTIRCTVLCWSGEATVKPVRDQAFTLLAAVEQILLTNPSLASTVLYSRVAAINSYSPLQDENGVSVLVDFSVSYRAYLQS